jgi:hypothetical protein
VPVAEPYTQEQRLCRDFLREGRYAMRERHGDKKKCSPFRHTFIDNLKQLTYEKIEARHIRESRVDGSMASSTHRRSFRAM